MVNEFFDATIKSIKTSKREIVAHILLVFILPILLIDFGIIPVTMRITLFGLLLVLLMFILFFEKWNFKMLGFYKGSIKKYLLPYALFTGVGVFLIVQFAESLTKVEELQGWWRYPHFIYLFFIVSLLQEVAYRGYLMPALGKLVGEPASMILINAILFTLLHTMFPGLTVGLPVAFVGGIGFAIMYYNYPSLPLIVISHSILNFLIVLHGFFVIPGVTY